MQQHDSFIAACQSIPSRVHIIPPHESLATVLEWVQDQPSGTDWSNTLVALDFDQTITHVRPTAEGGRQLGIRGGQASVHALRTSPPHRERYWMIRLTFGLGQSGQLQANGAALVVVSAASPSPENVHFVICTLSSLSANLVYSLTVENSPNEQTKTIATTLRSLGLDDCFGVQPFDPTPVHELLRSWGPNEHMALAQLTKKLITLLVLFTDRWPRDLARIGHSPIRFDEQFSKVSVVGFTIPLIAQLWLK